MGLTIDLSGRRAVVTGVTQGVGAGIARALARAGADVAGCATQPPDDELARRFLDGMTAAGRHGFYFQADLLKPDAPGAFIAAAAEALSGIDLVVSNAGRNIFRAAAACSEQDWNDCLNLDLASHWRLARAARERFAADTAAVVIFISSNHAFHTMPGCFPYNVAKAGLNAMVQSLALEWGPSIRAVGVAPGFIDTPGNDAWFASFPDAAAKRAEVEAGHPAGRIGTSDDVGALCAFLASNQAAFITGSTILIDGGRSASMGW